MKAFLPPSRCIHPTPAPKRLLRTAVARFWASWRTYWIKREIRQLHSSIERVAAALGYRADQMPFIESQMAKHDRAILLQSQLRSINFPHIPTQQQDNHNRPEAAA